MSHIVNVHLSQTETKKIYNKYNLSLGDLLKDRYITSLRFFAVMLSLVTPNRPLRESPSL